MGPRVQRFWDYLTAAQIEIVAFDERQARAAPTAFDRFGKGIDPAARLNLSDCAASATDIPPASAGPKQAF